MDIGLHWKLLLLDLHRHHCSEAKLHSNGSEPRQDESQGGLDTLPCLNSRGFGHDWHPEDSRAPAAQGAGTRRLIFLAANGREVPPLAGPRQDVSVPMSRGSADKDEQTPSDLTPGRREHRAHPHHCPGAQGRAAGGPWKPPGALHPCWGFASWPFTGAHSSHQLGTHPCEGTLSPCCVLTGCLSGRGEGARGMQEGAAETVDLTRGWPPPTLPSTLDPCIQALWFPRSQASAEGRKAQTDRCAGVVPSG